MNILFDFITVYIKTGVGEYHRRIFFETMNYIATGDHHNVRVYALYDSSIGIAYDDLREDFIKAKYSVEFLDCKERSIVDLVEQYRIDRFFIACAQHYRNKVEISNLKCEVICVSHDLCFEENYKDKIYLYWDMIEPGADSPKKFSRLGALRKFKPIKKILGHFDVFSWRYISAYGNNMYKSNLELLQPAINLYHNNRKVKLVTVSEYSKHALIYYYDIKESDISVLYSPERIETIPSSVEDKQLEQLVDGKKKYYLMVSANRTAKNPHKVINAFSKFAETHPDSFFVTLGYPNKVFSNHIPLPFLSDGDLAVAYANCHALIYPSFFEGFGYPPIEAMHYGKPVLCSNTTSMPEILENAPIYFSPFYESAIFGALSKLNDHNYSYYERKSQEQYTKVNARQEKDLQLLIEMIVN